MTASPLDPLLKPHSIAVVGASNVESKWGYKVLHNIISNQLQGQVYPVNPGGNRDPGAEMLCERPGRSR